MAGHEDTPWIRLDFNCPHTSTPVKDSAEDSTPCSAKKCQLIHARPFSLANSAATCAAVGTGSGAMWTMFCGVLGSHSWAIHAVPVPG